MVFCLWWKATVRFYLDATVWQGIAHDDGLVKGSEGIVRGNEDKGRHLIPDVSKCSRIPLARRMSAAYENGDRIQLATTMANTKSVWVVVILTYPKLYFSGRRFIVPGNRSP
jgi:hypothetical protein